MRNIGLQSLAILLVFLVWPAQAQDTEALVDRAELIVQVTPERVKKLNRKANKVLKFARAQGRYLDHRIVVLNTEVLQTRDTIPQKPKDDSEDVSMIFEMSFTPVEGEDSYILKNEKNYKSDFMGQKSVMWMGIIENQIGERLGKFSITDMEGKFDFSGFSFDGVDFGWGVRDIPGVTETTIVKMSKTK